MKRNQVLKNMMKLYATVGILTIIAPLVIFFTDTFSCDIDNILTPLFIAFLITSVVNGCMILSHMRLLMDNGKSKQNAILECFLSSLVCAVILTVVLFLLHLLEASGGATRFAFTFLLFFSAGYLSGALCASLTTLLPKKTGIPLAVILYGITVFPILSGYCRTTALAWIILSLILSPLILLSRKEN